MRLFLNAATELLGEYRRAPGVEPLNFTRTEAYRQFAEAAEQTGFTGPDVETDVEFSDRSPEWVAEADNEELRRWVHTMLRADRWNGDYPNALLIACRSGCLMGLVARLVG